MPLNRALFCAFPPMSRYRFTNRRDLKKEETVDTGSKRPEGYRGTPREALDRRYGEIGISAVAAAMRYQGDHKSPAPVFPTKS